MARGKTTVTRTYAPIHFEDLEPHRFEDLIRQLIYDFRDWRSIEATGRSGDDGGFDIRAYEKLPPVDMADDDDDAAEAPHPMNGPLWMIQGKREQALGPRDIKKILLDVNSEDPPYGYILAASAVFSKRSYDAFRDELRKKGVMEFYLWGRSELEDMLYLPKNDRILFAYTGVSLVGRRRSRATEVRAAVTVKNKLHKALGQPESEFRTSVLIRDINDSHYPFKQEYHDFDKNPRWIERTAFAHHPRGVFFRSREFYAYVDRRKKEWDFTDHADDLVLLRDILSDAEREVHAIARRQVAALWDFLPRSQQGTYAIDGIIPYADILFVDPEGDGFHKRPHIFVEFVGASGPYSGFRERLLLGSREIDLDDTWHRVEFFPKKFGTGDVKPRLHTHQMINLEPDLLKDVREYKASLETLFALDGRYDFLRPGDVVAVAGSARAGDEPRQIRIYYTQKAPFREYLDNHLDDYMIRRDARRHVGRDIGDDEQVTVIEARATFVREEDAGEIVE